MPSAIYAVFFFTVLLIGITAYFLMGGLPLLILKHDIPLDARFVRSFFNVYYRMAFWAAIADGLSFALWGRFSYAVGAVGVAVVVVLLRQRFLPVMQQLGAEIETGGGVAIRRFRQVHATALLVNLVQLSVLVWGLIQLSRSMQAST